MDRTFIHIPKTGGTSVRKTLKIPKETYHRRLRDFESTPENTFTIVRNPYDRAVSICGHQHNFSYINPDIFEKWCLKAKSPILDKKYNVTFHDPMLDYITLNGEIAVKDIIRFENLEKEFKAIFGMDLLHYNKGNRDSYQNYYTEVSYNIITDRYKQDIEAFNYTF